MSQPLSFTDSQKQYLAGFVMGSDVARAVRGLPVLAGSAASVGTTLQVGGANGTTINDSASSVGPERIAIEAQDATVAAGGKLCKEELAKRQKNPLDMWDEIIARGNANEFPKGTDVFLQKFQGLFYVTPAQESYMMRLRIPGGVMHAWQLLGLADLCDRSAGGYIDVTTRANLQIRQIPADQAGAMLYGIRELDLISLGSGGDNIRNCTASSLSGIDPTELIETIPLAKRMHHYILQHREMFGLPRKFNIAFDGGGRIASLEDTNDIGFRAVRLVDGDESMPEGVYFQLTLGGITGHLDFARSAGVLLTSDQCLDVAGAIVRVFVRHGNRTDRKLSRLKYVLDAWGFDKFIEAVEKEAGFTLPRVDEERIEVPRNEDRLAHVGFHAQKQPGKSYVGVVLPVGRMTSDQARSLSEIARRYGTGEIRWTVWQNLLIPHIDDADIAAVKSAIEATGLDWRATAFRAGLVACTGSAGCKFAGADTKAHAIVLAEYLESRIELDEAINIHLTGCHHSCAQHYIGDIGLVACQVEQGDDMVDGYSIVVGGGWGDRQAIGKTLAERVPFDEIPPMIANLLIDYQSRREQGESFHQFIARADVAALATI